MTRLQKILLFGFLLVLAGMVYLQATQKQPVNWFPSYHKTDKIPLGTYVLYSLLQDAFGKNMIEENSPPFEVLKDSTLKGTYFFINDEISLEQAELDRLYKWAEKGNTIFISANYFSGPLLDTLKLEMNTAIFLENIDSKPMLNLVNKKLKSRQPFLIDRNFPVRYFKKIDTLSQTVLGISQPFRDTLKIIKPNINYLKIPIGKGTIYLHSQPEAFSNFFLLMDDGAEYVGNALSYVNNGKTFMWDNYYKSGKPINLSPLKILFGNKYLKWAYYFVLIGALLFIIFEGKRKQRSVLVVIPLKNKTYDYTRTISGMYLDKKQNDEIARKQIALFFEYIRIRLRIPTDELKNEGYNSRFINAVASRSGNTVEDTRNLFSSIENIQMKTAISQEELKKLYQNIKEFKTQTDGKPRIA